MCGNRGENSKKQRNHIFRGWKNENEAENGNKYWIYGIYIVKLLFFWIAPFQQFYTHIIFLFQCLLSVCLSYIGFYSFYQFFFLFPKTKKRRSVLVGLSFNYFYAMLHEKKKQNMAFGLAFIVNSHFIFIFTHELSLSNLIIYISN